MEHWLQHQGACDAVDDVKYWNSIVLVPPLVFLHSYPSDFKPKRFSSKSNARGLTVLFLKFKVWYVAPQAQSWLLFLATLGQTSMCLKLLLLLYIYHIKSPEISWAQHDAKWSRQSLATDARPVGRRYLTWSCTTLVLPDARDCAATVRANTSANLRQTS